MTELAVIFSALTLITGFGVLVDSPKRNLLARLQPRKRIETARRDLQRSKPVNVLLELPDFCSILWFLLGAGHTLENALRITVSRTSGLVSQEFNRAIVNVDLGSILQTELEKLAQETKYQPLSELATKLVIAQVNGSSISDQLGDFSISISAQLRSFLLEKATKSETKMMIPLVFVILPVTVVFALYPSVAIIQQSFSQR